jgi:hypothetical protein
MLVTLLLCASYGGPAEAAAPHSWEPIGGGAYLLHVDGRPVGTYYQGRYRAFLFDANGHGSHPRGSLREYGGGDSPRVYDLPRGSSYEGPPLRNGNGGNGNGGNGGRPVIPGPYYEGPTFGSPRMEWERPPRMDGLREERHARPRYEDRPRYVEPRRAPSREPWSFEGPSFSLPPRARPDRY